MNTLDFLQSVLPERGLYVASRLINKQFRNRVCDSIEELTQTVLGYDAQGVDAYFACAAYREREVDGTKDGKTFKQVRVQRNVRALRSFWMDLDVEPGNDKKYESHEAALDGLVEFCTSTSLPIPMVVSSGGGIHIYWALTEEIQPEVWKQTAEGLKQLAEHYKFKADPACTADSARVLRPVGTYNRKVPNFIRPVEIVVASDLHDYQGFADLVRAGLGHLGLKLPEAVRRVEAPAESINQAFAVKHNFPPCSGVKVAERCQQLRVMRDTRGCIPEPYWYAGIQLLCHSIEGDELIHQWSNGHESYSVEETNRKIAQVRGQALGPTLCTTFQARNPAGCDGCLFLGKISSPAQLGTQVASAPAPIVNLEIAGKVVNVVLPAPPPPFTRGESGGLYYEDEGITHKIYEHDFFPVEMSYDEQLGYETTRWRHFLPEEGWLECVLRSSLLARPVEFESALRDNHIQPLIRNKMAMYGDAYLRKLRSDTKMRRLFKSQGWKSHDTEFVLGDKLYRRGEVSQAGFSHGATDFLKPFHTKGERDVWTTLAQVLERPGFEPHLFLLLLAFAAPLLKLGGRQGFTVNALGASGAGKSTMAAFMSSVYGHPSMSWITRDDTALARMQRLGAHNSLPAYMDEATTIPGKELRDLVYAIPTGKSRASMRADYTLRPSSEWATIFITSSNVSLGSTLRLENPNAEAELLRLFEYRFPKIADFGPLAKLIPGVLAENYGVAGPQYIQHIVEHRNEVKARLATIVEEAEQVFGMQDEERFWSQALALTLYGGRLANECGVLGFDPSHIQPWLKRESQHLRQSMAEGVLNPVQILADYYNEFVGERLVVTKLNAGLVAQGVKPMRELSSRYEKDSRTIWTSRKHIKRYLDEHHYDFNGVKDDLMARGILVRMDVNKTLGMGTDFAGGPTPCWQVNAAHDELAGRVE
ncbi:MAG: hypothetical protein DDT20_01034 [Firmicutes bacterium]|nr:hypothetical protein [Bacillota bacterium]